MILYEYRWYFPAHFDSEFFSGRQASFHGIYRSAFYAHIIAAPLSLTVSSYLLLSGRRMFPLRRDRWTALHRLAGRFQAVVVLMVVVPSGLVMSCQAYSGAIAGAGLATLSIVTAGSLILAIHHVRGGNIQSHRKWATRCCILLASPLLLRLMSGLVVVMQLEPPICYRLNVWLSWLIPLACYELAQLFSRHQDSIGLTHTRNEALQ